MSHLTYFKVQNFKCFDEIEVKDIGQFNLIVGDNNVGKTALMEAMSAEVEAYGTLRKLYLALLKRSLEIEPVVSITPQGTSIDRDYYINFLDYLIKSGNKHLDFEVELQEYLALGFSATPKPPTLTRAKGSILNGVFTISNISRGQIITTNVIKKDGVEIGSKNKRHQLDTDSIIVNSLAMNDEFYWCGTKSQKITELATRYTVTIGKSRKREREFINYLNLAFKTNIDAIRVVPLYKTSTIEVATSGSDEWFDLSTFGFGTYRFFEILICLYLNQDSRVFIDEIDTGIHHSRLPEFLKTILTLAKDLNVQLFMTTHSKECEEAFAEVIQGAKLGEDFRLIRLLKNKENQIKASVHNSGSFIDGIKTSYEFRNS